MVKSYVSTTNSPINFDVCVGQYNIAKQVSKMHEALLVPKIKVIN